MRIAIIGCGEVGLLYSRALHEKGHALVICDIQPNARAISFCENNCIALHTQTDAWVNEAELVLSCVVGTASLTVARAAIPHLNAGSVFADSTTTDPEHIRQAAAEAAEQGVDYVDIAIMSAIAMTGLQTPLLCAGTGAAAVVPVFTGIGAPIRVLEDGRAGDPAALKILRSVFTKGLEALAVECFIAAAQQGVTEKLFEALADIDQTPLRQVLEAWIRTHVVHAPRRLHEVEEAERQLRRAHLPVAVTPGVRALFERTCADIRHSSIGMTAPTATDALNWLLANAQRHGNQAAE